VVHFVGTAGA